jgi:tRNA nucleotidyltransferase (CCA-adding enzyme)
VRVRSWKEFSNITQYPTLTLTPTLHTSNRSRYNESSKVDQDTTLKIFLVGGAVRDELLGRPIHEKDWVVVGSTPEAMIKLGYQAVGKDFPVFLHPKTKEEYALARTERKTAKGYKGFQFYTSPDVSLSEDLIRRDLTINAMAKDAETGEIFDPYHGQHDLEKKSLHHVSPAFSEDPVRILRVARFASQLPHFRVHEETNKLMHAMVKSGEADALVAERVWKELSRALIATEPARFFEVLKDCDALSTLFPELHTTQFNLSALQHAVDISEDGSVRFAVLLHDFTAKDIQSICNRFRVPREFSELALITAKYYATYRDLDTHNHQAILDLLKAVDALRRPERFDLWLTACNAIGENIHYRTLLFESLIAIKNVDVQSLLAKNLAGKAMADALYQLQLNALKQQAR